MINCPYCGKLTDPKLDSCPHCGGYVQKNIPGRPQEVKRSSGQTCPNCQALVHDGDIICVGCGTNLLTGQKIADEKTRPAGESRNLLPWLALGGVVLVVAVVGVVFAYYAFTRDPVKHAVQLAYSGNLLEAGNELSKHLEKHDDDARAYFELGRVQWRMNRMTEAANAFEKAYANAEDNAEAGLLAVVAYGNSMDPSARQQQIGILMDLTDRFPDNAQAWYLLALALGAQGDVQGQIEALKKAADTGADSEDVKQSLAMAFGMNGEFEKAQETLAAANDAGADTAAAAGFLASLAGDYDVAKERLEEAVAEETSVKTQAQTRLGLLLLSEGRGAEAASYLAAAADQDKRNMLAKFFHAIALEQTDNEYEALTALEEVANSKNPLAGEAAVRAANLYLAQGNYEKAREAISRAENAGLNTAAFHTVRGRVFLAAGEAQRASEAFDRARQADPEYPGVYLETGLLHISQQEFRQAIEQLETYLQLAGQTNPRARTQEVAALVEQLRQATRATRPASAANAPDARQATPAGTRQAAPAAGRQAERSFR